MRGQIGLSVVHTIELPSLCSRIGSLARVSRLQFARTYHMHIYDLWMYLTGSHTYRRQEEVKLLLAKFLRSGFTVWHPWNGNMAVDLSWSGAWSLYVCRHHKVGYPTVTYLSLLAKIIIRFGWSDVRMRIGLLVSSSEKAVYSVN